MSETDVTFVLGVMTISLTAGHQLNNKSTIESLQTLRKVGPPKLTFRLVEVASVSISGADRYRSTAISITFETCFPMSHARWEYVCQSTLVSGSLHSGILLTYFQGNCYVFLSTLFSLCRYLYFSHLVYGSRMCFQR